MDRPDLEPALHNAALSGLARLNRWSNSVGILWPPIRRLAAAEGRGLTVLDVASGAGDVAIGLERRARRAGLPLQITGCDISPTAIGYAELAAKKRGANVRFEQRDVLASPPTDRFDVVTCSLFLHHLEVADAQRLLRSLAAAASRLVLVNDLVRGRAGKLLAEVACRALSRSPVVHVDGPRSVEGAFTLAEAKQLADAAGLAGAEVLPRWPCRMLIQWERPDA